MSSLAEINERLSSIPTAFDCKSAAELLEASVSRLTASPLSVERDAALFYSVVPVRDTLVPIHDRKGLTLLGAATMLGLKHPRGFLWVAERGPLRFAVSRADPMHGMGLHGVEVNRRIRKAPAPVPFYWTLLIARSDPKLASQILFGKKLFDPDKLSEGHRFSSEWLMRALSGNPVGLSDNEPVVERVRNHLSACCELPWFEKCFCEY